MPNRLRNEECQFQVFVNEERIVGLKVRVRSWNLTLNVAVEANEYTGEVGERYHEVYKGGSFDFTIHPIRPIGPTLDNFIQQRARGEASGQVDIHLTGRFRTGEREKIKLLDCYWEDPSASGEGQNLVERRYQGKARLVDIQ